MDLKRRSEEMRAFFERKSDGYDDVHLGFMKSKAALTEALPDGTKKVLDLGAGTGLELIPLFTRFPDAQITAVDISPSMLAEIGKRSFAARVTSVVGAFFQVDLGSGYDAVISTSALHHFMKADKARLYAKVYECLKPGGWFVNSDKIASDAAEAEKMLKQYAANSDGSHIDTPLTETDEITILMEAGFAQVRADCVDPEHPNYRVIAARK